MSDGSMAQWSRCRHSPPCRSTSSNDAMEPPSDGMVVRMGAWLDGAARSITSPSDGMVRMRAWRDGGLDGSMARWSPVVPSDPIALPILRMQIRDQQRCKGRGRNGRCCSGRGGIAGEWCTMSNISSRRGINKMLWFFSLPNPISELGCAG